MAKKNLFESMTLQIPLTAIDVAEFYSLSEVDKEIVVDECRTLLTTKLMALRAIKSNEMALLNRSGALHSVPLVDPPDFIPAGKLKSSYSPPEKGCIRRI